MIDGATATLIAVGVGILVEASAVLVWGGMISADIRRLKEDVRPVTALAGKMATLEERIDSLLERLGDANVLAPPVRRVHARKDLP